MVTAGGDDGDKWQWQWQWQCRLAWPGPGVWKCGTLLRKSSVECSKCSVLSIVHRASFQDVITRSTDVRILRHDFKVID